MNAPPCLPKHERDLAEECAIAESGQHFAFLIETLYKSARYKIHVVALLPDLEYHHTRLERNLERMDQQ